ncbi:MAG: actin-like protein arp8 [Cirrosporium novae-zelandiae]|nr:MAG: actin-like protein arp8 [Cirrosporium novae-zelandiae]
MELTSWPQVSMINQKNYYTEYLKRDDQLLALRLQNEEHRNEMAKKARDRDRELAMAQPIESELEMDTDASPEENAETAGSKTIVIHVGSQNLRIGFGSDALPKTVPMVIARKWKESEAEEDGAEPKPKRLRTEDGEELVPEKAFGEEFGKEYTQMTANLKLQMRNNKRRLLPNSKELVVNYNRKSDPEIIPEHNDPLRIDWTEIPSNPKAAPDYVCGKDALRIPDFSKPRYKLFWPIRHGWYNEHDYKSKTLLLEDVCVIIHEAIKTQLGLKTRTELGQYRCVFVIPDLYEKNYVCYFLDMLIKDLGFNKCCFIQESLAASFGAGYTLTCIVDIGAQKTSICCVEDGMCIESSRVNIKTGGSDVTDAFIRMMLYDHFPYADINLRRRYDAVLAEELKIKTCSLQESSVSVQLVDFHLRAPGQDTRKYTFKTYDEPYLAPLGYFQPSIFNHEGKLIDRRRLIDRSHDLYDNTPNDPVSLAQIAIMKASAQLFPQPEPPIHESSLMAQISDSTTTLKSTFPHHLSAPESVPRSLTSSPVPGGDETTTAGTPAFTDGLPTPNSQLPPESDSWVLPLAPLDHAICTSIFTATHQEDRRARDFFGGIMLVGGGSLTPNLASTLEDRLKSIRSEYAKDIMVGVPPRELDPQVVVWKGASVFGKLESTNDGWIGWVEYDRLGSRVLAYKLMFCY